jgi:hypothetical protein
VDLAGYIASSLVFLTFYMKGMIPLRLVALCSNVAFLIYAFALHLAPIAILHGALIPMNVCRLISFWRGERAKLPVPDAARRRRTPSCMMPPTVRATYASEPLQRD